MPIDWSQISQARYPTGGVVATGQSSNSTNLGDSSDIMSGALQGQQYKMNQMKMDAAQGEAQDSAELRAAAQQGTQALFDAHDKQGDPMFKYQVQQAQGNVQKVAADTALAQAQIPEANAKTENLKAQTANTQADTDIKAPQVISSTVLALGSIADKAHNAQIQAEQAKPGSGQAAGAQVYSFLTSKLPPATQQSMKDNGLDQWNLATNTALHTTAIDELANQKEKQEQDALKNMTPLEKNATTEAKLQLAVTNGTATDEDKQTLINMQQAKTANDSKAVNLLLNNPSAQKQYITDRDNFNKVSDSLQTLNVADAQLKSMSSDLKGPMTGAIAGKLNAQGQAVSASLNQLVLQAPALLGLPGSALRIGSLWKIIQSTKPATTQWADASSAIVADLKYMGALKQQSLWKSQAEQMQAQKDQGGSAGVTAERWFKQHPEPMKSAAKPNLEPLYKLFPQARNMGLESDWDTVKSTGTTLGSPQGQPQQSPQSSKFQVGQSYKDANGNRAVYQQDGTWQEQK